MIRHIIATSPSLIVSNPINPQIYNNGMLNVGQLRFNPGYNNIEVFDGNQWQNITQHAEIKLDQTAEDAIRWANNKMREEAELKVKMEKYPALKAAFDQLETVKNLCAGPDTEIL